jgi:hypothetical protein
MSGILIAGGLAAAGTLGSGLLKSSAAKKAASTQADAATKAAQMQAGLGEESLGVEENENQQNNANEAPYLQSGANSLATLDYLMGVGGSSSGATIPGSTLSIPGSTGSVSIPSYTSPSGTANTALGAYGSLMKGYGGGEFQSPTAEQARQTPGYQFALNEGEKAVQAGASAQGSLLTGGTLNAENQFAQGMADTNYNTTYNQALQNYNMNYNTWANQQANQFNRLSTLIGGGQTAAQELGSTNTATANQVANTLSNTGQQVGANMNNAAAATASGYVGSANALGSGITGATGGLSQMMMLNQLMNSNGSAKNMNNMFSDSANALNGIG